jgi:hypothetical protein
LQATDEPLLPHRRETIGDALTWIEPSSHARANLIRGERNGQGSKALRQRVYRTPWPTV